MSTRPFVSLRAKRLTLFACLIMVAAAVVFFGPAQRSLACPSAPMPLRPLYVGSHRVVVARAAQSTILQTEKMSPDSEYERTLLRTSFYVSKTLKSKGEEEQVLHVYQWLWGGDRAVPEKYAEGERLLLFLIPREEGEGYELTDDAQGAKDLSDDGLKVYIQRIEELAKILSAQKPDKAEIVEWLVRCAEEPATRWEGAYELYVSQSFIERETGADKDETEDSEGVNVAESSSEEEVRAAESAAEGEEETVPIKARSEEEDFSPYSAALARLITAGQKKRLADTLFSLQEMRDEDWSLFNLVESWRDERMVGFLLSHLEKAKDNPHPYVEYMVRALAEQLRNEKLAAMAEKYCENANYEEDEAEAEASGEDDTEASSEDEEKKVDEEEKALSGSATQKRSARLKHFLAEAQSAINHRIAMAEANPQ